MSFELNKTFLARLGIACGTKDLSHPFLGHAPPGASISAIGKRLFLACCARVEVSVTHMEIKALENTRRTAGWTEGYDGESHYAEVLRALAPAFFILSAAAALMVVIL
jgi:hypothetical protein